MVQLRRPALLALGAAVLMSACAPGRVVVKPEFFQDRQVHVGVALTPYPEGGAHKAGAQGLLDMAINSAMASDLQKHLAAVDIAEFDQLRDRFVQELGKRGMNAVALPGYLDPFKYPERPADAPQLDVAYDRDLRALGAEQKVDIVVLLQVSRFGTIRSYYGFIPLGAPQGLFQVRGQMVDVRNGQVLWHTMMAEQAATVPATGDWDQPPNYPNLTAALRAAIANGNKFLMDDFFVPVAAAAPVPNT
jgi:hypothetical protein